MSSSRCQYWHLTLTTEQPYDAPRVNSISCTSLPTKCAVTPWQKVHRKSDSVHHDTCHKGGNPDLRKLQYNDKHKHNQQQPHYYAAADKDQGLFGGIRADFANRLLSITKYNRLTKLPMSHPEIYSFAPTAQAATAPSTVPTARRITVFFNI